MARRQVLVQLDDRMVAALDEAAREEGVSRSELLRTAAELLLERRRIAAAEEKMIEGYRKYPPGRDEQDLLESMGRIAAETLPPY